jgi:hypothetical protein
MISPLLYQSTLLHASLSLFCSRHMIHIDHAYHRSNTPQMSYCLSVCIIGTRTQLNSHARRLIRHMLLQEL